MKAAPCGSPLPPSCDGPVPPLPSAPQLGKGIILGKDIVGIWRRMQPRCQRYRGSLPLLIPHPADAARVGEIALAAVADSVGRRRVHRRPDVHRGGSCAPLFAATGSVRDSSMHSLRTVAALTSNQTSSGPSSPNISMISRSWPLAMVRYSSCVRLRGPSGGCPTCNVDASRVSGTASVIS